MKKKNGLISYLYELLYLILLCIAGFRILWPYIKELSPEATFNLIFESEITTKILSDLMFAVAILLVCLAAYLLMRIAVSSVWTKCVFLAATTITLISLMIAKYPLDRVATDAFYVFAIMLLVDIIQFFWKKEGQTDVRSHVLFLAPMFIVFFILLVAVPAPEKKMEWTVVVKIYREIVKDGKKLISRFENINAPGFGDGTAGFGEKAQLLGNIEGNDTEMMTVRGNALKESTLYLAGKTFDKFDGKEWKQSGLGYPNELAIDNLEMVAGVKSSYTEASTDVFKLALVEVTFADIKSRYMFYPLKVILDGTTRTASFPEEIDEDLKWQKQQGYDTRYQLTCNLLNDNARVVATNPSQITDEAWTKACQKYDFNMLGSNEYETLIEHRRYVYDTYLDDFETSEEVKELLAMIVGDADNDFDKLERIAAYLQMGEYSTTPAGMGRSINTPGQYLEYFLCERTEGFCIHYATAFVLMARMEGIPARYVQGYYLPRNKNGEAIVYGNNAHAWPEAYIDNVGWLIFEPTPGYYSQTTWETAQERRERYENNALEHEEALNDYYNQQPEFDRELLEILESQGEETVKEERNIYLGLLVAVCSVFLIAVVALLVLAIVKNSKYMALTGKERVIAQNKRSLLMLTVLGYPMEDGETLSEYRKRIYEVFPAAYSDFLIDYELIIYGKDAYEESMLLLSEKCMSNLKYRLKKEKKRIKYYIKQYYTS